MNELNTGMRNNKHSTKTTRTTKFKMGPIEYISGSHKKVLPSKSGLLLDNLGHKNFICNEVNLGECLIFSQLLVHRSGINLSKKARISLQIRFNDMSSVEWKKRNFYTVEQKSRELPPPSIKEKFKIK